MEKDVPILKKYLPILNQKRNAYENIDTPQKKKPVVLEHHRFKKPPQSSEG